MLRNNLAPVVSATGAGALEMFYPVFSFDYVDRKPFSITSFVAISKAEAALTAITITSVLLRIFLIAATQTPFGLHFVVMARKLCCMKSRPDWLSGLDEQALFKLAQEPPDTTPRFRHLMLIVFHNRDNQTIEEFGQEYMDEAVRSLPQTDVLVTNTWQIPTGYWDKLKKEFKLLLCTSDPKYRDVKTRLSHTGSKSETAVVSMIAAAVGSHWGVTAGVLVPFVSVCLIACLRMGKEAFCASDELHVPIKPKPEPPKRKSRAKKESPSKITRRGK